MNDINMKILNINGEVMLAAADSELMNRDLREGKLHLNVKPEFYGEMKVSEQTFISSLGICTIANLVGEHVVNAAIDANYIDKENIIKIDGVPHAQLAKIV
ncbi:MAG: DUF424 family protein [Candidatus Thermoplasmatota archaeon]|uniref:DUF424 domain-containing protein n=1 Tax=Ferroplasma sp. TaxID=2591003 RepID=UPI0025C606ED|nr:DUF424 family protein [Ferroplasma sp.]MCL4312171.1 DUF424 family protein [Candidatus Thermoplasmatota archaeon]